MPKFHLLRSLQSNTTSAVLPSNYGLATVYVLFPEWCGSCRKMMKQATAFAIANGGVPIYVYGLMYPSPEADRPKQGGVSDYSDLSGTPAMLVGAPAAEEIGAVDFPFALIAGNDGHVRWAGSIHLDAFDGNGQIQRTIERIFGTREKGRPSER